MKLEPDTWLLGFAAMLMMLPAVIVYRVQDRVDLEK